MVRNVSKVNFQTKHTKLMVTKVGEQHWFVCIVKRACKHSCQIMSSALAAENTPH